MLTRIGTLTATTTCNQEQLLTYGCCNRLSIRPSRMLLELMRGQRWDSTLTSQVQSKREKTNTCVGQEAGECCGVLLQTFALHCILSLRVRALAPVLFQLTLESGSFLRSCEAMALDS